MIGKKSSVNFTSNSKDKWNKLYSKMLKFIQIIKKCDSVPESITKKDRKINHSLKCKNKHEILYLADSHGIPISNTVKLNPTLPPLWLSLRTIKF